MPYARAGPAEPLATAAGILGLMAVWRTFYTTQLDLWNYRAFDGSPIDRRQARQALLKCLVLSTLARSAALLPALQQISVMVPAYAETMLQSLRRCCGLTKLASYCNKVSFY